MKNLTIIVMITAFAGCLDVETSTTVHSDGTLSRTVTFTGDSSAVYGRKYPLTIDEAWETSIIRIDDRKFRFTAVRTFADAVSLNKAIAGIPNKTIDVHTESETSFQWFVTEYEYSETYRRVNPFYSVPITDYISQAELDAFIKHEVNKEPYETPGDSLSAESGDERFKEWYARCLFEAYVKVLLDGVETLHSPMLTSENVLAKKEELFKKSMAPIDKGNIDTLQIIFTGVLRSRVVRDALAANREGMEKMERQMEFLNSIMVNDYKVKIEMPGTITDSNAPTVEGNIAKFSDFIALTHFMDFEMKVTSRMINWWAILVTIAIVALGGVFMVAGRKKR